MHIQVLLRRVVPCMALLLAGPGAGQTFFTKVPSQAGPTFTSRSTAWGDYDNDGWPDLFFAANGRPELALWHNEGGGGFSNQTATIRGDIPPQGKGGGSIFGDYDHDGDLDIYVPVGLWVSAARARNALLRNDRGVLHEVGLEAGLTDVLPTDNAIWLDYDRDGHLDLYTGNLAYEPFDPTVRNKLYRNQGDDTFVDVTQKAGLDLQMHREAGGSNGGMAAGDFNDDGWPDLYVGVFGDRNRLFLNDTKGGFVDATTAEIADPTGLAFGVAVGDIDNDGDLDIFQCGGGTGEGEPRRSLMLLNRGGGKFLDVTDGVGLSSLSAVEVMGAGLADIDNDGDLDLVSASPGALFLNNGDGIFTDRTAQSGGFPNKAIALSVGDYDLDGFLDLAFGDMTIFHNNRNDNHYLRVELAGARSNRNGIGARLTATIGDLRQTR